MCHLLRSCWAETTPLNKRPHSASPLGIGYLLGLSVSFWVQDATIWGQQCHFWGQNCPFFGRTPPTTNYYILGGCISTGCVC